MNCLYDASGTAPKMVMRQTMKMNGEEFGFSFTATETGQNNGILIEATATSGGSTFSIAGAADDNGGYVEAIRIDANGGTYKVREAFKADGSSNGIQPALPDGSWPPDSFAGSSYSTQYDSGKAGIAMIAVNFSGITGSFADGDTILILPQGTGTPSTDTEKDAFGAKVIGCATFIDDKWEIDYFGTQAQISNACLFIVTYNTDGTLSFASIDGSIQMVTPTPPVR